jgi:hypothetical protein
MIEAMDLVPPREHEEDHDGEQGLGFRAWEWSSLEFFASTETQVPRSNPGLGGGWERRKGGWATYTN